MWLRSSFVETNVKNFEQDRVNQSFYLLPTYTPPNITLCHTCTISVSNVRHDKQSTLQGSVSFLLNAKT